VKFELFLHRNLLHWNLPHQILPEQDLEVVLPLTVVVLFVLDPLHQILGLEFFPLWIGYFEQE